MIVYRLVVSLRTFLLKVMSCLEYYFWQNSHAIAFIKWCYWLSENFLQNVNNVITTRLIDTYQLYPRCAQNWTTIKTQCIQNTKFTLACHPTIKYIKCISCFILFFLLQNTQSTPSPMFAPSLPFLLFAVFVHLQRIQERQEKAAHSSWIERI